MAEPLEAQVARLTQAFQRKGIELSTLLHVGLEEASLLVEGRAASLAPVDTGLLKKSITHRVIDRKGYPVGQVGTNVEYAPFQEFGTSKMAPQPFLMPALNQSRASIQEIIARRLRKAL
jgi:HK97 gp10 family phage protein